MRLTRYIRLWMISAVVLLCSCSTDYINVIPNNCVALVAIDFEQISQQADLGGGPRKNSLLGLDDLEHCGIDLSRKGYLFEAADGSMGLVVALKSSDDLKDWAGRMKQKGTCSSITQRKGFDFFVIHDNFVVGFSDDAALIMGPSVGAAQAELRRRMCHYLKADDNDVSSTDLFERLSSLDGAVTMVAQSRALPDKLLGLAALGSPVGTDSKDVCLSAVMQKEDDCLVVSGSTFSFDEKTEKDIRTSWQRFKPVSQKYLKMVDGSNLFTFACNVKGEDYVAMLHDNAAFKVMLAGLNTVLDMDMMLKTVDGDLLLTLPTMSEGNTDVRLLADAKDARWLADVAYWKTSCPKDCRISDGTQAATYLISGSKWNTCFGILSPDFAPYRDAAHHAGGTLFFTDEAASVDSIGQPAASGIDGQILDKVKEAKVCAIIRLKGHAGDNEMTDMAASLLEPLFGDVKTIVYRME